MPHKRNVPRRLRFTLIFFLTCFLIILPSSKSHSVMNAVGDVWTTNGPEGGIVLCLATAPSNPIITYAGTSLVGIFKTTDGGITWAPMNSGLTRLNVQSLAVDPTNASVLFAATDNGIFKSTDGAANWINITTDSTNFIKVDRNNSNILYAGANGFSKSTDGGITWTSMNSGLTELNVKALVANPSDSNTLYVGTGGGGIFKSVNGGVNWTPTNAGLTNTLVRALAIDPVNSSTVYAGTNGGVFKSTNAGANWIAKNGSFTHSIAIDPANTSTILIGTDGSGILRTEDGGASWISVNSGLTDPLVRALEINPFNPTVILAGTDGGGVFKTANGGTTWTPTNTGLINTIIRAIAIDPINPSTIYAASVITGGIFKTTNGGMTWAATGTLTNVDVFALAIDPIMPSTLYAGTSVNGVFKSTNGGTTWTSVNSGLTNGRISSITIDPFTPTTIYVGTIGGGIFKSLNGAATWTPKNSGLSNFSIQALVVDPVSPTTVYVGTNGSGVFKSLDGGISWMPSNTGLNPNIENNAMAIDPTNSSTLYVGTGGGGVFKSSDSGLNWMPINLGITQSSIRTVAVDPTNPNTIYAGGAGSGVFRSTDAGATWTSISVGLPALEVRSLAINPVNSNLIYAGTGGAGVFGLGFNRPPIAVCRNVTRSADECTAIINPEEIDNSSSDPDGDSITLNLFPIGPYPLGNTLVTLTVTDSHGVSTSCSATITVVDNTAPTIAAPSDVTAYTGSGGTSCSTMVNDTTLGAASTSDNCGGVTTSRSGAPAGNVFPVGVTTLTYTARDNAGNAAQATQRVTVVDNTPPTITCPTNITTIADVGTCAAIVNYNIAANDNCDLRSLTTSLPSGSEFPLGTTTVNASATDAAGNASNCSFAVTVTDPNPLVTITAPLSGSVFAINTPVNFTGTYTDAGGGTHSAIWSFDTMTQAGTVTEPTNLAPGTVSATHTFTAPGVYLVSLAVSDSCGETATADTVDGLTAIIVVYDPNGGFITGGGWIDSPFGAYTQNPSLVGKAVFGFQSRYQSGATVPTGSTEFRFQIADFKFSSTSYQWLVVSGARGQYKGFGTVNGAGNYGFLLTGIDGQIQGGGGLDRFRIKIWDNNNGGAIIYDNQRGSSDSADPLTVLRGGNIVIQK